MKYTFNPATKSLSLVTETPADWLLVGQLSRTVPRADLRSYPENQKTLEVDLLDLLQLAANRKN